MKGRWLGINEYRACKGDESCVLIGADGIGKRSLLWKLVEGAEPNTTEILSNILEAVVSINLPDGHIVELRLTNTRSGSGYMRMNIQSCNAVRFFVLCFSIADRESFVEARERWFGIVNHHWPTKPIFLMGLQCDLTTTRQVPQEEAAMLRSEVRAIAYYEISSVSHTINVQEAFTEMIQRLLLKQPEEYNPRRSSRRRLCMLQ